MLRSMLKILIIFLLLYAFQFFMFRLPKKGDKKTKRSGKRCGGGSGKWEKKVKTSEEKQNRGGKCEKRRKMTKVGEGNKGGVKQ